MVYAFECERCQVKVYSVSPRRERGCPVCSQPMTMVPVGEREPSSTPPRRPGADPTFDPSASGGIQPA